MSLVLSSTSDFPLWGSLPTEIKHKLQSILEILNDGHNHEERVQRAKDIYNLLRIIHNNYSNVSMFTVDFTFNLDTSIEIVISILIYVEYIQFRSNTDNSTSLNEYLHTCISTKYDDIDYTDLLDKASTIIKSLYTNIFQILLLFDYFVSMLDEYIITDYFDQSLCYTERLNEQKFRDDKNDLIHNSYIHITDYINTLIKLHRMHNIYKTNSIIIKYFIDLHDLDICTYLQEINISDLYVGPDPDEYCHNSCDANLREALYEISRHSFNKITQVKKHSICALLSLSKYTGIIKLPVDIINIILLHYIQMNNINIQKLSDLLLYINISNTLLELLFV